MIFTLALIATLTPYVAGADFGVLKVPELPALLTNRLRILGPAFLILATLLFLPLWPTESSKAPKLEKVEWCPAACAENDKNRTFPSVKVLETGQYIQWRELKLQIADQILPHVELQADRSVEVKDLVVGGRKHANWVVAIVTPDGRAVANIWFGVDPLDGYAFDGLVRVGVPAIKTPRRSPVVWETFQYDSNDEYQEKFDKTEDRPPTEPQ
jgi:hypothetical protein